MKKMRLVMFEECNRNCAGCCNKDWDFGAVGVCDNFSGFDLVMLTGGEPMLKPSLVLKTIERVKEDTNGKAKVYVYTAKVDTTFDALQVLEASDGMCVTLHEQSDVEPFLNFAARTKGYKKSLRVNIFKGVRLCGIPAGWKEKRDMEWIKDCPLPDGEILLKL